MTYRSRDEIPATIREVLPVAAQDLYLERYNTAWEMYQADLHNLPRESVAHQAAWEAVNREFVHDEKAGTWYRRGEAPAEDAGEEKGFLDKLKDALP